MNIPFSRKLAASYIVVVGSALLATGAYLTHRMREDFLEQLKGSLAAQAVFAQRALAQDIAGPLEDLQARAQALDKEVNCRITVIRKDGVVLADSERSFADVQKMDNHAQRPEVVEASGAGLGHAIRFSRTLQENMLYVARPFGDYFVRIALPLTEVERRVGTLQKDLLTAGAVAITLALLLGLLVARRISRPLETLTAHAKAIGQGQFSSVISVQSDDEFGRLAVAFGDMAGRVEEMVRESDRERTQLAAILAALVESVVALDHQGRILFVNSAAERLFHLTADEAKGRPSLEALRHSPLNAVLSDALSERRALTREVTIHAPEEHILSVHAVPVAYAEHSTGVLAALHDVTELRRLERVRQEFVANVTHELGTPLTAILGFVETLLAGAIDDPVYNRDFLHTIQEHALRLKRLIDDILTLSSVEGRRAAFRIAPMSLKEVLSRVIKGLAPVAQAKKVSVIDALPATLPFVVADPEKIEQILINLIDNALKFTPEAGRIEIHGAAHGSRVEIAVQDTGTGIPAEDLPRIFERFYRVEKARSREMGGTGLGLSIVKHLIEAQGGTVRVESQVGKGSTFRFTLPLA